jgi:NitT/TauT family transport system permease protein/taurine transport system permease protein
MEHLKRALGGLSAGLLLLSLLVVWEIYARATMAGGPASYTSFPPPSAALHDAYVLLRQGLLLDHALASLKRVYVGFALAALVAIPLGVLMGLSKAANAQLSPLVNIIRPIPPVAWVPIMILWFGVTNTQQYAIIFIGTLFPVLLNTIAGVRGVDPVVKRAALSLGADRPALFGVVVRAAMPDILLGARVALGMGWFIIVASEMVAASNGLGFLITEARTAMLTQRLYVSMAAIGLIGVLQDQLLVWLQRRLVPWQ